MFHVKLSHIAKHNAFLGFRRGAKKVIAYVTLLSIEAFDGGDMIFTVAGHTESGDNPIHVPRVMVSGRYVDAARHPYLAGQEAGEIVASWWKRNGFAGEPETPLDPAKVDPDFTKWMEDAA